MNITSETDRIILVGGELDSIVSDKQVGYMEACTIYCDKYEIEVEQLGELLRSHQRITSEIRKEAMALNFIKKDTSFDMVFE